ncbi:hypothetical protein BH23CHL2_BH23CHL2_30700 [soil metagenome]
MAGAPISDFRVPRVSPEPVGSTTPTGSPSGPQRLIDHGPYREATEALWYAQQELTHHRREHAKAQAVVVKLADSLDPDEVDRLDDAEREAEKARRWSTSTISSDTAPQSLGSLNLWPLWSVRSKAYRPTSRQSGLRPKPS